MAIQEQIRTAEEALRAAVERARESGYTWQEIGTVLGTSRQAAFQRFGRPIDPRTGEPMIKAVLPDAAERAIALFVELTQQRWQAVQRDFDETMAAEVDTAKLTSVWAQVAGMVGRYERMGEPIVHQAGDFTVVNIPLFFEAGEMVGRVAYRADGKVGGLFILPEGAP